MSKCEVCGCESPWHSDGCSGLIDDLRAENAKLRDELSFTITAHDGQAQDKDYLAGECAKLRAALEEIADSDCHYDSAAKLMRIARKALANEQEPEGEMSECFDGEPDSCPHVAKLRAALEEYTCPGIKKCNQPKLKDGTCVHAGIGHCGDIAFQALANEQGG